MCLTVQVTVDIAKRLRDVGLAQLPQCCWPSAALVNELATKTATLQRAKVTNPFVFLKLQEWLPQFAQEHKDKEKGELVSSARCPACISVCFYQATPMTRMTCVSLPGQCAVKRSPSSSLSLHSCGVWHWICACDLSAFPMFSFERVDVSRCAGISAQQS